MSVVWCARVTGAGVVVVVVVVLVVVVGIGVVVGVGVVVVVVWSRRLAEVVACRLSEPAATSAAGRVSSSACREWKISGFRV